MQVVRDLDEARWRRFVDGEPAGNVFQTPEMFEVFRRAAGHRPELWAALDGPDVAAVFTPVHVTAPGLPLPSMTSRAVAYGSILAERSERGASAARLVLQRYRAAVGRRSLFTELRCLDDHDWLRPVLDGAGFTFERHLNYLVAVDRDPEEILGTISRSTRKRIRRGLRAGDVQVAEVRDRAELGEWYRVLCGTYRHARVPVPDLSLFTAAFDVLVPRGMIGFFAARVGGVMAACSAELRYKDTVYGWYGGSDRSFGALAPNEILMWHVLEWSSRSGCRVYDFGGAGSPDEEYGVRDFKAKFGGRLVDFGRYTCVHARLRTSLGRLAYRAYRRLPGREPARATAAPAGERADGPAAARRTAGG